ncbi:MAG: polysaccharide lyase [Myxococcales bacterium]
MKRIFVALIGLLCLSTAARASVVWRGDFETGDITQWNHFEGLGARFTVVPSPVREGQYALRTEVRQGDIASNGTRNELDYMLQQGEGTDLYYSWSTMFPAEYPNTAGFQVFTQWHQQQNIGNAPPVVFHIANGQLRFTNNVTGTMVWSAPLVRGVWHDFIAHIKWSSNASVGFCELWYNGQHVASRTFGATLFPGTWVYLKQGLYRDNSIAPTAVVFHDGMTVATALDDVLPPPAPATPPPPATPPTDNPPPTDTTPSADSTPPAEIPPTEATPAATTPVAQTGVVAFPKGGCTSAPADLAALLGIAALALRIRRKR